MTDNAMSAEAWNDLCVEGECRADELKGLVAGWDFMPSDEDEKDARVYPDCHRIAAVALHGQPFGFTRDDVTVLTWVALRYDEYAENAPTPTAARIHDLAARIEALLPPPTNLLPEGDTHP